MKKYTLLFAALGACMVFSCDKGLSSDEPVINDETPQVAMKTVTITATIDDELESGIDKSTKTSYSNAGAFSWTAGDKISVLGDDGNFYTFTANTSAASTTFTGTLPDGVNLGSRAYFPADASHTSDSYSLPSYKDISSHNSADIPMFGKKGDSNNYTFFHCAGAALLTITNIPNGISSVTITVESYNSENAEQCVKLSGVFYLHETSGTEPYWDGAYAVTATQKQYSRKVSVSDNTAKLYIPCAGGYNNWVPNVLNVTGHGSSGDVALVTNKAMKKLGPVNRAHILPLAPLVYSQLGHINWPSLDMYPLDAEKDAFPGSSSRVISWKATSDSRFVYFYIKYNRTDAKSSGSGDYIYLGFDTDNDPSSGTDASYMGKVEARAIVYPIDSYTAGTDTFTFDSSDAKNYIQRPVGSSTGKPSLSSSDDGSYLYTEIAIDRTKIGSPASNSNIGLIVTVRSEATSEQTIKLQ